MVNVRAALMLLAMIQLQAGCIQCPRPAPVDRGFDAVVTPAENPQPSAVVILVHGLNMRPDALNDLARMTRRRAGVATKTIALAGHRSPVDSTATLELWREDIRAAVAEVGTHYPGTPIYLMGYSLGAALGLDYLGREPASSVAGMLAIAPPIGLTRIGDMIDFLTSFLPPTMELPSFMSQSLQVHPALPVQWYLALGRLIEDVRRLSFGNRTAPVLTILNPIDELVDFEETAEWMKERAIPINSLRHEPDLSPEVEHLLVTPHAMGEVAWQKLGEIVANFIHAPPATASSLGIGPKTRYQVP